MSAPKIAIVGAGPGGLTLARLLQINGISCAVYEAEPHRHTRNQGGSLDLHSEAGQAALKEAGLFEDFQKHSRPEGQALKLVDFHGHVVWDENEASNQRPAEVSDRPEIDRASLRDILLDSIETRRIKWGHKISHIEADPNSKSRHSIHLADGTIEAGFDLIVGADGAWSKVRSLVSDEKPHYSSVTAAELWAFNVSKEHPWLDKYVGQGSVFMFDAGRAVMCQRNGNDSIRVYACVQQPETWKDASGFDWSDHNAVRNTLVGTYFGDCGDDVKRSILECTEECVPRQLWMLPVGYQWEHRAGITLLGDSAHLMTPFAGIGVNLAMRDALDLANELVSRKNGLLAKALRDERNIDIAVKSYEKEMFVRSKKYAQKTLDGMNEHFAANGGQLMVERVLKG